MSAKKNDNTAEAARQLRTLALRLGDVEEGVACAGTALESTTFKVRGKAFLFVGAGAARLVLDGSLGEARRLAAAEPDRCQVGSGGWVKIALGAGLPARDVIERWIAESYAHYASSASAAKVSKPAKKAKRR